MIKALSIIMAVFIANIFASPHISPTATRIMREIRVEFRNEKAREYLSIYLRDKDLTNEQIVQVRERMDYFFDSDKFLETGAAYLTAFFNENELSQISSSVLSGRFFDSGSSADPLMRRVNKLLSNFDPLLYHYLERHVMPQPKNQE